MKYTLYAVLFLLLLLRATADEKNRPAQKLSAEEQALLNLLNAVRKKESLPPLTLSAILCQVARGHAENMARQGKREHTLDGKGPGERLGDEGYGFRLAGENLHHTPARERKEAEPSANVIHTYWMGLKRYRDNIVHPEMTEVGLAMVRGKDGSWYTALLVAAPNRPADEKALFALLNEVRRKNKLPPLALNASLSRVARAHAENMARQEKMEHILDGKGPAQRVAAAGYDYRLVRENLARAGVKGGAKMPVADDLFEDWMNSKEHRDNILHPRVEEVGVGMARSKKGTYYYTQVFASPQK